MRKCFLVLLLLIPATMNGQAVLRDAFPHVSFDQPTDFQAPPTESNLVFVTEKDGRIYVMENDSTVQSPSVFLDIRDRVLSREEQGVFAMDFHPNYAENGYFYVHHTAPDPRRSVIARYTVDPDNPRIANETSREIILTLEQPHSTHNGGELEFGPDGYMYASFGDGKVTGPGDPYDNGQDLTNIFSTVIRINVDSTAGGRNYSIPQSNPFVGDSTCGDGSEACRGEIYAYGFRNPWRFSFDAENGRMWLGDVGHNSYEEVNIVEKGGNYGWSITEGTHCFDPASGCDKSGLIMPVHEYAHGDSRKAVTGGVVYRGSALPSMQGKYIFADQVVNKVFIMTYEQYDGKWTTRRHLLFDNVINVISFGEDRNDEIYMASFDGNIYTIANEDGTAIADAPERPESPTLLKNYPNPFNPSTNIQFRLPNAATVELSVYNSLGREVRGLVDRKMNAGEHTVSFNGEGLPSGMYIYRLSTENYTKQQRMLLLK